MYKQITRTAIGMAVLVSLSNHAFAADPLGQLKSENKVEVISGGVSTIVENDVHPIFAGDTVNTMAGSSALIRFTGDVGFVQASEDASVTVDKPGDTFNVNVESGQTQFMFQDAQNYIVNADCINISPPQGVATGALSGGFINITDDNQGSVRANNSGDLEIGLSDSSDTSLLSADTETQFDLNGCGAGSLASVMGGAGAVSAASGGGAAAAAAGSAQVGVAATATALMGTVGGTAAGITVIGTTDDDADPAAPANDGDGSGGGPVTPGPAPTPDPVSPSPRPRPTPPSPPVTPPASPVSP